MCHMNDGSFTHRIRTDLRKYSDARNRSNIDDALRRGFLSFSLGFFGSFNHLLANGLSDKKCPFGIGVEHKVVISFSDVNNPLGGGYA